MKNKFLLLIIVLIGAFLILKMPALFNKKYPDMLWDRISKGETTASACEKAAEQYRVENAYNSLDGTNQLDSFYSYKKERCFGLEEQDWNKTADMEKGHEDRIFDLITGDTLVSCRVFYNTPMTVYCSDNQNNWTNDKGVLPPPYPIFLNTWQRLKFLGGE